MFAVKHGCVEKIAPLVAIALLAGCAAPLVDADRAAPEGSAVALGQAVRVGRLAATPQAVTEDSRCPENVRCVWAGRLTVSTLVAAADWRETVPLTLGKAQALHGTTITLVSGLPEKQTAKETPPGAYRFAFEGGN